MENANRAPEYFTDRAKIPGKRFFLFLSQRRLLLFLVCQGIQKYTRMDLLMTERLRS